MEMDPPPITHPLVRRTFTAAAPRKIPGVAQWMEQPAEGASDKLRPSAWQQQHSLHKRGAWQQAAPQAKAASMLTSEDIRSGEPAQPPGPSVPDEQSAAAAGRVSSAPVVQPETPFANASLRILCKLQAWAAQRSSYDTLRNVRTRLCILHGLKVLSWDV